jgi:integrase
LGKLNAIKVRSLKAGRHADGDGLYLYVKETGARYYVLRVQHEGRRRDIGLGSADLDGTGRDAFGLNNPLDKTSIMLRKTLTLGEAREKAAALRKLAKTGADPIAERDKERGKITTFAEAVEAAYAALSPGWAERSAKAFIASLNGHASPRIGKMDVDKVGLAEYSKVLNPIWTSKPVIAKKVSIRVGQVLAFAKAQGWRKEGPPDPRELRAVLPRQPRSGNFAAVPFAEVPEFFQGQLSKELANSRGALLFAILTAARSGEVRQAQWEQIDFESCTWTLPADVMKMRNAHVVMLSSAAIALLERVALHRGRSGLVFPGKRGEQLSDMSLTKIMRLAGRSETVHGFRSSFRDWAAEKMPATPGMVAEIALAHRVGSKTEQAYLRTDLRDMRRLLMSAWGSFVAPSLSDAASANNVVPLMTAKAK